jgi:hypothetical protein
MGREGWENYMYYEASPLSNMKMPKIKPILQLMKPKYIHTLRGIPIGMDSCIASICFLQQGGIIVFIAQGFMLLLHF